MLIYAILLCTTYASQQPVCQVNDSMLFRSATECRQFVASHHPAQTQRMRNTMSCVRRSVPTWEPAE